MYKRILIVVDPRQVSRAATQEGLRLAKIHSSEVTFVTVLPRYPLPIAEAPFLEAGSQREFEQAAKANADKLLSAARDAADKADVMSHGVVGRGEDAAASIVEAARKRRCEMIVVASEGRNALLRLLTGSVIPGLITASPVPVLICKQVRRTAKSASAAVVPIRPKAPRKRAAAAASSMR